MATKTPKKKESKERASSSTAPKTAPEQSASQGGNDDKGKRGPKIPISIWPEWSDVDIAAEKWDMPHKGKEKEKGKSPNLHAFEDPEGRVDLPVVIQSNVECWKRPVDFLGDKVPVIVDCETLKEKDIDLLSSSSSVADSEVMRWIIADITNLMKLKPKIESIEIKPQSKDAKDKVEVVQNEELVWKPWQHIWPKDKNKNGVYPSFNPGGKYVVKIFWMGLWRKVIVDDWMPFNSEGVILLPTTKRSNELWPMLLSKALIKVASLDYHGGEKSCEFGDYNVVQCLTGWMPEIIPLRREHSDDLWDVLSKIIPRWKLENSVPPAEEQKEVVNVKKKDENSKSKTKEKQERSFTSQNTNSERSLERESRLREMKDSKDKFLSNGSSSLLKDVAKEPEFAVFASYSNPPARPTTLSVLKEMADASEKLRQSGLSHNHPHSVLVTLLRDCPLVAPPPPIEIPRWKLIRQKKRKQPRDPRLTPVEPPKDPKFLEVTSPFVSYCVSPTPVGRARTPVGKKYAPDKENMTEIAEEGDRTAEVVKNEPEKSAQLEQRDEPKKEDLAATVVPEPSKVAGRVDKMDDKKEIPKAVKDRLSSGKPERPSSREKEGKQKKGRKISKMDQGGEKKTEIQTKSPRRLSKTDIKGVTEKDGKKGKAEKEVKNAMDTDTSSVLDDSCCQEGEGEDAIDGTVESGEGLEGNEGKNKDRKFWIEYDDFWKCFSTLFIYHKPLTYTFSKSHLELKNVLPTGHIKKSGTGIHTSSATAATVGTVKGVPPSPVGHHGLLGLPIEPPPPFLFVDSVAPIEIVVCFTSFSKWLDPPLPIFREKTKGDSSSNVDIKVDSATDCTPPAVPPPPGLLVAEPYSWKSLVTGQPCLRMKTTGSKAAVLVLPPGRHVLRFLLQSPHGYHVGLSSQTPFTFGEEDLVMACLVKESCRFIEHTTGVLQNLGHVISMFGDLSQSEKHNILDLGLNDHSREIQERHYKVFMICLMETLSSQLGDEYTRDAHFAWKAFDFIARVYLKERCTFRPRSSADVARIGSVRKKQTSDLTRSLSLSDDQVQPLSEDVAATKIQSAFKGHHVRKMSRAYQPDTAIHQQVNEQLTKSWVAMEANLETYAIQLYRKMFKLDPGLFPLFPFYKDEWTRVTFMDYNGTYGEQPGSNWFLLFREVFFVDEDVLTVPKMYTNIPSCFLRVVNNDTFEEIPKVFQRVAPYTFKKNKHGYTFLAEARSSMSAISAGKFRLRLIGSTDPLPAPEAEQVNTHFVTKEVRDYYIPNKDHVLFRYSVQVAEDLLISVQLCTSKPDVFIKLQVLDNEQEVCSSQGRGHTVLPVYIVRKDRQANDAVEEDSKRRKKGSRPQSKDSIKDVRPSSTVAKGQKSKSKKSGGKESSPGHSRPSSGQDKRGDIVHSITQEEDLKPQVHKYIIQAIVLRDSWPLTRENWEFVQAQKTAERQDDVSTSENASRSEKSAGQSKGKKGKDGKESRSSKNQPGSRPASQQLQFDPSKPSWTLRVISDASCVDDIDVKRDTERQDEIKAMKAAWEAAEPGRAAKAQQSRQKFLNENLIKITTSEENEPDRVDEQENTVESKSSSQSAPSGDETEEYFNEPPPRKPSKILKPFDITPYIRCEGDLRIVLDEDQERKFREKRQEMFREYKIWRDDVVRRRELDRVERNRAKERQIQQAEEWQASLDKIRDEINTAREAYRQTFIVQEPVPEAEEVVAPTRSPSPAKGRKGSKSPKAARKSPKGKKK